MTVNSHHIITNNHRIKIKLIYVHENYQKNFSKFLKQFSMLNIKEMSSQQENRDLLKIQPFYKEEIESVKKMKRKTKVFTKNPKELTKKQLSDVLAFPPKKPKRPKKLTKYQILRKVLPLFDDVGVLTRQYAFKNYVGTYDVEVMDSKSLDDSLFLAKKELIIFSENYQKKKKELNKFYQQELLLKNGMMQLILMILIQFIVILIQQK